MKLAVTDPTSDTHSEKPNLSDEPTRTNGAEKNRAIRVVRFVPPEVPCGERTLWSAQKKSSFCRTRISPSNPLSRAHKNKTQTPEHNAIARTGKSTLFSSTQRDLKKGGEEKRRNTLKKQHTFHTHTGEATHQNMCVNKYPTRKTKKKSNEKLKSKKKRVREVNDAREAQSARNGAVVGEAPRCLSPAPTRSSDLASIPRVARTTAGRFRDQAQVAASTKTTTIPRAETHRVTHSHPRAWTNCVAVR